MDTSSALCDSLTSLLALFSVLVSDMDSNEYSSEGLGGVRCAVGSANQV